MDRNGVTAERVEDQHVEILLDVFRAFMNERQSPVAHDRLDLRAAGFQETEKAAFRRDPDYGRVGYISRGAGVARPRELVDRFPAEKSECMTAAGIFQKVGHVIIIGEC